MPEQVTIIMPMPPKVLTPNGRPFSRRGMIGKAVASKKQRLLAIERVEQLELDTIPWPAVSVKYIFYHPVNRRRDDDNYIASMKAARDGIVQAGLVTDDNSELWLTEGAEFLKGDPKRVEIVMTKIEPKDKR
jgi:Holliday junction resolvase RusA-like endonuclease